MREVYLGGRIDKMAGSSGTDKIYTEGIKAQAGRFYS
jgi:hypothetical protein